MLPGPAPGPGLAIFHIAFWELTSERHGESMPIPWSSKTLWAKERGLDATATESLMHHVTAMDLALLKWKRDKGAKDKGGKGGGKPAEAKRGGP